MRVSRHGTAAIVLLLALACHEVRAAAPLHSLLIQRSDLRAGYGRNSGPGYTHRPQLPDGSPLGAHILGVHGYLISYVARFADYGDVTNRRALVSVVAESGDKFRAASGARWEYQRMVEARYPQSLPLFPIHIGNQSSLFTATVSGSPGSEIDLFFRRNKYVVRIAVGSRSVTPSQVLALARLVDGRIRANG